MKLLSVLAKLLSFNMESKLIYQGIKVITYDLNDIKVVTHDLNVIDSPVLLTSGGNMELRLWWLPK